MLIFQIPGETNLIICSAGATRSFSSHRKQYFSKFFFQNFLRYFSNR